MHWHFDGWTKTSFRLIWYKKLKRTDHLYIREILRLADYKYGYVLVICKVYTYSQSSTPPSFSEYGYGYEWEIFNS